MAMARAADLPFLPDDLIIFDPRDVDLRKSPLRGSVREETFVLGAFNPGLTRLPTGNLLMMVRVAEALRQPIREEHVFGLRWSDGRYVIDRYPRADVDDRDPRSLVLMGKQCRTLILTSLSWLLPVELSTDGRRVERVHYDRIIEPQRSYQEYGVEDPRISRVDGKWYMTTCSVSAERHCTTLHVSDNGLDYRLEGIVLDHQNKDMLLFEGKVGGKFMALTRPMGECYFSYAPDSDFLAGPCIQFAQSPDALHWKPLDKPGIRARRGSPLMKLGGGSQPILTDAGWLIFYHGVEVRGVVGIYRTFWALLDRDDPATVLKHADDAPLLEARPEMSRDLDPLRYVHDIVFTTGVVEDGDSYILASGEDDLACRITRVPKPIFTL
jgi:beta-1,2-mannobiose phosphorylase / 1,2-beta-oligomannan phosphorylase